MNKGLSRLRQILILALRVLARRGHHPRRRAAARRRLARPHRRRAGHRAHPARSLRQHGAEEHRHRREQARRRPAAISPRRSRTPSARARTSCSSTARSASRCRSTKADALLDLPQTEPTDTAADIPGLLQAALDYITTNKTGRTDVWLLSDLAARPTGTPPGGRWQTLAQRLRRAAGRALSSALLSAARAGRSRRDRRPRRAARDAPTKRSCCSTCASSRHAAQSAAA